MKAVSPDTCRKVPACQSACPAGIDIPRYIRHLRSGEFSAALAVNREKIPFPSVCGYACVHPCEAACARKQIDEPVAVRLLKRAAVELGGDDWKSGQIAPSATGKKVVVVGAGPAGLTAAYCLARRGHEVTVLEALREPGGMMRYGIPEYRLPRPALAKEVAEIVGAGVKIETGVQVEMPAQLLRDGFDAVLVTVGAWRGAHLGVPGEENDKVLDGFAFLKQINSGERVRLAGHVVVVGGGNTAIDAARTAVRSGAKKVTILYRRTRDAMPASDEEIEGAFYEGVQAEFLAVPVKIEEKDGALELTCQRMQLGKPDASGRPRVSAVPGSDFAVHCDRLLVAVGQTPELGGEFGLPTGPGGTVQRDRETFATAQPGIFAAGDVAEGPTSIIEAITQGRKAASAIDRFLGSDGRIDETLAPATAQVRSQPAVRSATRPHVEQVPLGERLHSFATVELGYGIGAATKEAHRCLGCDLLDFQVTVDATACKECGYCQEVCKVGVYDWANYISDRGYRPMLAVKPENCIGCGECIFACPDFAITVVERECGQ